MSNTTNNINAFSSLKDFAGLIDKSIEKAFDKSLEKSLDKIITKYNFATKDDLKAFATKVDLKGVEDRLSAKIETEVGDLAAMTAREFLNVGKRFERLEAKMEKIVSPKGWLGYMTN
jgi:hypothetical protein